MKTGSETSGATERRLPFARGKPRAWIPLTAFLVVGALLLVPLGLQLAQGPAGPRDDWKTSFLNFGSNPVSSSLAINFGRISYIDQPTEWNTSGFVGGSLVGNGSFITNSSGYGIMQFNSTANKNGLVNYGVAGSLGPNVSYVFTNQRVALNGSTAVWYYEISEAAQVTAPPSSGNVSSGSAGAAQNILYVKGSYSSGNYTFSVGDFEWKNGNFQTFTSASFAATVKAKPLVFFNVYVYMTKTATVVSIANTLNASILGTVTAHPVLDGNLTKIAYLSDFVTMASGSNAAMILDRSYLVDHNAYAGTSSTGGGVPAVAPFEPFLNGVTAATVTSAPFDPANLQTVNYTSSGVQTNVGALNSSLASFSGVTNSSTIGSESSSQLNRTFVLNGTSSAAQATARQTLTTLRAAGEPLYLKSRGTLYITSWTPSSITSQITSFLKSYVSSKTGIAANQVQIMSYLIENITVTSSFSSSARSAVQQYIDSALPSMLATNHLALVNTQTGAIDAGADIGEFMDLATSQVYPPKVDAAGHIFDPVNGQTYVTAEAAGFPAGSFLTTSGAIHVTGQGTFLGFNGDGIPMFQGDSCFIVCLPSLSGAAQSVGNFLSSAATSVTNAVGTVTNAVSTDVIQPVSGTLATDMGGLVNDASQAIQNIAPIVGGSTSSATPISSFFGNTLGNVGSSLASAASGAVGALTSGVSTFSNEIYHLGSQLPQSLGNAAGTVVNTLGSVVNTAAGVISPYFTSTINAVSSAGSSALKSLASLGAGVASAGMNALNSVGGSIQQGLAGAWSWAQNAFGGLVGGILNGATGALNGTSSGGGLVNWFTSLGGSVSTLTIVIIIVVLVVVGIIAAILILHHRRRKHAGHEVGGEHKGGSPRSHRSRGSRHRAASWDELVLPRGLLA